MFSSAVPATNSGRKSTVKKRSARNAHVGAGL
jgi:hypothetical protein